MDVIKFEDKDGKLCYILEGDSPEPVPVQADETPQTTKEKPKEEQ